MQNKFFYFSLIYLASSNIFAAIGANHPTTFLGPTLKFAKPFSIDAQHAFAIDAEAGLNNIRVGLTGGLFINDYQRFKVSVDYLRQHITYGFFSGDDKTWVQQFATGASYQFSIPNKFSPTFETNGYVAHAPSKSLSTKTGIFIDNTGAAQSYIDQRRIAGSNAYGLGETISVKPFKGLQLGLLLNYDHIHYDKKFNQRHAIVSGLGGGLNIDKTLQNTTHIILDAVFRKPYNNYGVKLTDLASLAPNSRWQLGLESTYTVGKFKLPNTYDVSLNFNYDFERLHRAPIANHHTTLTNNLSWLTQSAAYLPMVLAVAESRVATTAVCIPPSFIGVVPDQVQNIISPAIQTYNFLDLTPYVNRGSGYYGYTLDFTPITDTGFQSLAINQATNIVSITAKSPDTAAGYTTHITITVLSTCGTATTDFDLQITAQI